MDFFSYLTLMKDKARADKAQWDYDEKIRKATRGR